MRSILSRLRMHCAIHIGMESTSLLAVHGQYLITRNSHFDYYTFIIFPIFISIFVREYNFWQTTGESNGGEMMGPGHNKISLFNLFQFKMCAVFCIPGRICVWSFVLILSKQLKTLFFVSLLCFK